MHDEVDLFAQAPPAALERAIANAQDVSQIAQVQREPFAPNRRQYRQVNSSRAGWQCASRANRSSTSSHVWGRSRNQPRSSGFRIAQPPSARSRSGSCPGSRRWVDAGVRDVSHAVKSRLGRWPSSIVAHRSAMAAYLRGAKADFPGSYSRPAPRSAPRMLLSSKVVWSARPARGFVSFTRAPKCYLRGRGDCGLQ
jgi:hypothetical protein